jgi:hypothetical protein
MENGYSSIYLKHLTKDMIHDLMKQRKENISCIALAHFQG